MKWASLILIAVVGGFAAATVSYPDDSAPLMIGHENGNGGDVVVCKTPTGEVEWIELLDFWEAHIVRGINRDLGPKTLSVKEKIKLALSRWEKYSPRRARLFAE